ncbi:MAG: hypothetical protein LOD94_08525 [Gammaproteobacteria bacterium]|nr:hypothetical protein [Gammaproteobacteria bacterium]
MPYDEVRNSLNRLRQALEDGDALCERHALVDAIEALTGAVERDFAQLKAALSHLATLIERSSPS